MINEYKIRGNRASWALEKAERDRDKIICVDVRKNVEKQDFRAVLVYVIKKKRIIL